MTWSASAPQGHEVRKTRWRACPYLRGKGLDLGCGPEKVLDTVNVIGVDNNKDSALFGIEATATNVRCDISDLSMFGSASFDFVFSSHALEHFEYSKVPGMLKDWFRVLKVGGYLVLYLPDEDQYPKCAEPSRGIVAPEPSCNSDHRWNVCYDRVVDAAKSGCPAWDLVHFEKCSADDEYSLFFAFRKLKWN